MKEQDDLPEDDGPSRAREARITLGVPDVAGMAGRGYRAVDMHVHTRHSDAAPSVRRVVDHALRRGVGVAITDHNEVSGVRALGRTRPGDMVIPGIEVDCAEGPHILLYFYSRGDLFEYYDRLLRERRRGAQYMTSCPTADEVLSAAGGYSCLAIAAHPFGYFGLDRGVLKCAEKNLLAGVVDRLDGLEAICGGMTSRVNAMAVSYAEARALPVTGGSDAHLLRAIGSVVTGVRAEAPGDFLDGIRKNQSIVVGTASGVVARVITGGVIGCNYVPYAATAIRARLEPHAARLGRNARRIVRARR